MAGRLRCEMTGYLGWITEAVAMLSGFLLQDSGSCVRACPAGKHAKDGKTCEPCEGPCPRSNDFLLSFIVIASVHSQCGLAHKRSQRTFAFVVGWRYHGSACLRECARVSVRFIYEMSLGLCSEISLFIVDECIVKMSNVLPCELLVTPPYAENFFYIFNQI